MCNRLDPSFLIKELNSENCLWIYRMAHRHNHRSLTETLLQYISWHFTALCVEKDFLHLDLEELIGILSLDSLMVSSELTVFHLACRWREFHSSEHKLLPEDLLRVVRFPLMSPRELEEAKKSNIAISYHQHPTYFQLRRGMFEDRIICMDLQAREDQLLEDVDFQLDSYDPVSEGWEKLPSLKSLMCPGILAIGTHLYVAGGVHQDDSISNTLHMYDSVKNDWSELSSMAGPRCMHGFVAHFQRLYAVGGWNGSEILDSAECFTVSENCWTGVSNLPVPVRCFASTMLKEKLYLIGGETATANSISNYKGFLVYNPISDTWSQFPLKIACSSAGAVTLDNKIFVIGGYTNGECIVQRRKATSRCFCLDEVGSVCHDCQVPSLPKSIALAGVVRWKRRIYVLGGENADKFYKEIYYWTPGDSKWTLCHKRLPILYDGVSNFGCVTMTAPMECFHSVIQGKPTVSNFTEFVNEFHRVFVVPARAVSAAKWLMTIRQGTCTVSDYAIEFRTLAAEVGCNNEALVATFTQGLCNS
ncbi:uncharacterized protein WCC33_005068 [Rhinophrynus dorsalis]